MDTFAILRANLLSPMVLAFILGIVARLIRSDVGLPGGVVKFLSMYLLFHIGITGGVAIAEANLATFAPAALAVLALATLIPVFSFVLLRTLGRMDAANAAGLAAHYGSVSSVTFIAGINTLQLLGVSYEAFVPSLAVLMEWGLIVALFLGQWSLRRKDSRLGHVLRETLTGSTFVLLLGGMAIGAVIGEVGYAPIKPFIGDLFGGVLVFFLLEMGMDAAKQLGQFAKNGLLLLVYGTVMPVVHALLGILAGIWAGLGLGGTFIVGVISASASYINAPPAVRASLPTANPSLYLTASLGITLPFNLIFGLPLYWEMANILHKLL